MLIVTTIKLQRNSDAEMIQNFKQIRNCLSVMNPSPEEVKAMNRILEAECKWQHLEEARDVLIRLLGVLKEDQNIQVDPEWLKRHAEAVERGEMTLFVDPIQAVEVIKESRQYQEKIAVNALMNIGTMMILMSTHKTEIEVNPDEVELIAAGEAQ